MAHIDRKQVLLSQLSDGQFHSGQSLANGLGLSRTAVWKHIQTLQTFAVDIRSVPGFDRQALGKLVETNPYIEHIDVFFETQSTNQYLLDKLSIGNVHGHVVLAEFQTAGRGRRGNQWLSPIASGLCLSIAWHFETSPASLMALSLASGVAVQRALHTFKVEKTGLKWPNDIMCDGRKLGGILLESRIEAAGTCDVVLGLGLNIKLPEKRMGKIEQAVTDIAQNCIERPARNELAITVIEELVCMLQQYAKEGFAPFIEEWRKYDCLQGKQAQLHLAEAKMAGEVLGIDENGLLIMQSDGVIQKFTSGELSVRALT